MREGSEGEEGLEEEGQDEVVVLEREGLHQTGHQGRQECGETERVEGEGNERKQENKSFFIDCLVK